MKKLLIVLLSICISATASLCQKFSMDGRSVGAIVFGNNVVQGSAFVVNNPRQIVTCAHVVDTNQTMYYVTERLKSRKNYFKLKLVGILKDCDLAVLEAEEDVCITPLKIREEQNGLSTFETLMYMGYDKASSTDSVISYKGHASSTAALGTMREGNMMDKDFFFAEFIEYKGNAVGGYSGGPVLSMEGLVIGINTFAWLQQGIHGGEVYIMNRALSLTPLPRIKGFKK